MKFLAKTSFFTICLILTAAILCRAQVQAWGFNNAGQLGNGSTGREPTPVGIGQTQTTGFSGGENHTLLLQANGTVFATGFNYYGQLGDGTTTDKTTPVAVSGLSSVVQVAAGEYHSLALLADGTVKAWGYNNTGQLGDGSMILRTTPVTVIGLTDVVAVEAGLLHSLALKADGTVWGWGFNSNGEIGDGSIVARLTPVQVSNLTNVIAIRGGEYHTMALKSDGTVWVCGRNGEGEVGNPAAGPSVLVPVQTMISGVSQIAAGAFHNMALKPDGTVWVWGSNNEGEVGNGIEGGNQLIPVQSTTITGAIDIGTKQLTNYVRLRDGSIRVWGFNQNGEIGMGTDETPVTIPTQTLVGSGNAVFGRGYSHAFVSNPKITTIVGTNQIFRGDSLTMNFSNVTGAGVTSYTALDPTSTAVTSLTLPAGYVIQNNEAAYNLTTTASFTGIIQACLQINGEYNPMILSRLKLMHGEGSDLVDRTTTIDLRKRKLCAETTTLSSFVVALGPGATAAETSISGRVLANGKGLSNAKVELTGTDGVTRTVVTNAFGNFTISDIEPGATYVINISAKKYTFAPQIVSVTDNISGIIFTAQ